MIPLNCITEKIHRDFKFSTIFLNKNQNQVTILNNLNIFISQFPNKNKNKNQPQHRSPIHDIVKYFYFYHNLKHN